MEAFRAVGERNEITEEVEVLQQINSLLQYKNKKQHVPFSFAGR